MIEFQIIALIILGGFFYILSGLMEGVMDTIQFHYDSSMFSKYNPKFWNPEISWENKYKPFSETGYEPKFWGSTTFLVWWTDAWHLFKFMRDNMITV